VNDHPRFPEAIQALNCTARFYTAADACTSHRRAWQGCGELAEPLGAVLMGSPLRSFKGEGFSICVLQSKPEKWLYYRVVSLRQYKQAG
jgi:hypothetical protein